MPVCMNSLLYYYLITVLLTFTARFKIYFLLPHRKYCHEGYPAALLSKVSILVSSSDSSHNPVFRNLPSIIFYSSAIPTYSWNFFNLKNSSFPMALLLPTYKINLYLWPRLLWSSGGKWFYCGYGLSDFCLVHSTAMDTLRNSGKSLNFLYSTWTLPVKSLNIWKPRNAKWKKLAIVTGTFTCYLLHWDLRTRTHPKYLS